MEQVGFLENVRGIVPSIVKDKGIALVARVPEKGFDFIERCLATDDTDLRWFVRNNLKVEWLSNRYQSRFTADCGYSKKGGSDFALRGLRDIIQPIVSGLG